MRRIFAKALLTILFAVLASASTLYAAPNSAGLNVRLQSGSDRERAAEEQLQRTTTKYDLGKWVQTRFVVIEEGVIPHSHPVLTLNTRHLTDDGLFISTFIHEQTHWWLAGHPRQTAAAVTALKSLYKTLPVGFPDGADTLDSSFEHLLVICLELDGVRSVLGEAEEKRVLSYWEKDHYKKLYSIVERDRSKIKALLKKNNLEL